MRLYQGDSAEGHPLFKEEVVEYFSCCFLGGHRLQQREVFLLLLLLLLFCLFVFVVVVLFVCFCCCCCIRVFSGKNVSGHIWVNKQHEKSNEKLHA